ncbi:hypothetical protein [Tamlana sp. I1]|uniref:hypothetical protein n=1 Tax=Tamlana sp. I1 TaxID=2762061 RepID=UPI00188EB055|nr:hypothetical protein [Tamlana sp. I1]
MGDKKHIDRLFQESFKDFEATPSPAVWENIAANLNDKEDKRRVIPIWWRYAGAAALLLLFLTVGNFILNTDEASTIQVVETNETRIENTSKENQPVINNVIEAASTTLANSNDENNQNPLNNSSKKASEKASQNIIRPSKASAIAESSDEKIDSENELVQPSTKNKSVYSEQNGAIANTSEVKIVEDDLSEIINKNNNNTAVASTIEKDNTASKNETPLIDKAEAKALINAASQNNNAIAEANNRNKNTRTIEDALEEGKIKTEQTKKENKWSVSPNVAPIYFNSLGEGSSIDPQFNSNQKTGDINMSYGISTSYAVTKKITIRSGINKVNLGYNTNDVVIFESRGTTTSALQNIDAPKNSSNNISVVSSSSAKDFPQSLTASNVSIHQNLDYLEVPVEIEYTLSEKRLGVNVIGGFSSFFLNDNDLFSRGEDGSSTYLGEANNVNKTSYSANVGLGLNYKFSKKIDLNLEPMFKYQLNTFNNTSGHFTPYFIGVYTGFSIKF